MKEIALTGLALILNGCMMVQNQVFPSDEKIQKSQTEKIYQMEKTCKTDCNAYFFKEGDELMLEGKGSLYEVQLVKGLNDGVNQVVQIMINGKSNPILKGGEVKLDDLSIKVKDVFISPEGKAYATMQASY